ncbi:MAG TPA: hypothetical protein VNN09_14940 [Candidatus Competibacteraceae bacterium]|nr:hypothetical protein [Candidatus Competibacteraceae bacterium]
MSTLEQDEARLRALAEAVRDACVQAALETYEQAGIAGLCQEGRWECAVAALRSLDVAALCRRIAADHPLSSVGVNPSS